MIFISADSFRPVADVEQARALFARSVTRVEVETHSFCNRRCNYCPNVTGDRLGANQQMQARHWAMLMRDLQAIDYAYFLVFQSYNEPLADRSILERIAEARQAVPRARLMIYSNGDYLDQDYLAALDAAGLDYLHITIHTPHNASFNDEAVLETMNKLAQRCQTKIHLLAATPGAMFQGSMPHARISIEVSAVDYMRFGSDRGGLVQGIPRPPVRTSPCHFPFAHFYVGYNGNVMPCCHIRADVPAHEPYLYGNLDGFETIYQAWSGQAGAQWRRVLSSSQPKQAPCDTCKAGFLTLDPAEFAQMDEAWRTHVMAP